MYKDIYELPVKIFHRIVESGNLELLYITKPDKADKKLLEKTWDEINDQLIKEFGVSEELRMIFYKQQDINTLEIKALEGDTSVQFFINVYRQELENLKLSMITVTDYKKYHARLRRIVYQRYQRPVDGLSTFDFYTDLQDLSKEAEEKEMQIALNG
jgi:hypothetical protein